MARIQYYTFASLVQRQGRLHSDAASVRYRILLPAMEFSRRGHQVRVNQITHDFSGKVDPATVDADIVVFSKSLNPRNEELAQALRARGKTVIVDFCDNYFSHFQLGHAYRDHSERMCQLASNVVASTHGLAAIIREHTGAQAVAIPDPVEGPPEKPRFNPSGKQVQLLWFAHPSNWNSLAGIIPSLATLARETPLQLVAMTAPIPGMAEATLAANRMYGPSLRLELRQWSIDAIWQALRQCDAVVLPSQPGDFHSTKSANRIAEAIRAGRFVAAHPIPSYLEFADFAAVGEDIAGNIRRALEDRVEVIERLRRGQQHIEAHYTTARIADAWETAFGLRPPLA
jgi:glycosyltransferase involved in cell wall biosynthesis